MRIPRLKLSVRGLMLLIGGFALGIGADRTYQRFAFCMDRAGFYRSRTASYQRKALKIDQRIKSSIRYIHLYPDPNQIAALEHFLYQCKADRRTAQILAMKCQQAQEQFQRAGWLLFLPMPAEVDLSE